MGFQGRTEAWSSGQYVALVTLDTAKMAKMTDGDDDNLGDECESSHIGYSGVRFISQPYPLIELAALVNGGIFELKAS